VLEVKDRVQVRTFHSWCYWMLRTYGIPAPSMQLLATEVIE